ncbi:NTE family protein [Desulfatibacillum alkenivorans DSM 16219]|jgi:NTE family protein/lysophospholipid hydrolase|uniref:NTE family protein n=1 Tax=Desulfatibacillum alkenivorans DSM 16219 TaxID=1121393 RepID=A0A1M7AE84_9BACT|nr:NTE family protein [Desulfatibacillum alkenivorans DSM 16219]
MSNDTPQSAMLNTLRETYLFRETFSDSLLGEILENSTFMDLPKDACLFHQGDPGDAMYIVAEGELRVVVASENGGEYCAARIGPGEPVGEIQLLTGGKRTASVLAEQDAKLLCISRECMEPLSAGRSQFFDELNRIVLQRLRENQLLTILPHLFGHLDGQKLQFLKNQLEWVIVKKGERLFSQGEHSDCFYILTNGRLSVVMEDASGRKKHVNVIRPGECVGEMGMITEAPRNATIFAIRDSQLVRMNKAAFEKIIDQYPRISMHFMRGLVDRTKKLEESGHKKRTQINVAVIPASQGLSLTDFTVRLSRSFSRYGRVLHLSSQRLDRHWGMPEMSQVPAEDPKYNRLSTWLDEQEDKYQFIIYESDQASSNWSSRCLQQADHILVVGRADDNPAIKEIEWEIYADSDNLTRPKISLVLIHPDDSRLPQGTRHWLAPRQVDVHHHLCWNKDGDFDRVARFVSGNPVGLVLGGGGARGFAHLGVIRALEEFGIPIDMVCGASIGAIMGAFLAMGLDHQTRMKECRKGFVDINPLGDYTLPLVALVKSRILDRQLKLQYGDARIEDLWLNFFCVSSNLTNAKMVVHKSGPLWKAVRASISLPGILMPVFHRGGLLVDGGVINNLPADVMKNRYGGFIMLVDVSPDEDLQMPEGLDGIPSTRSLLWSRINPRKKKIQVPGILDIMMRTILLSSIHQSGKIKKEVDHFFYPPTEGFGLLDFKLLDKIFQAGYEYAVQELQGWKMLTEDLWDFKLSQSARH